MKLAPKECKNLRLRLGWCQSEMARHLNCPTTHVQELEAGKRLPWAEALIKFDYLMGVAEDNTNFATHQVKFENRLGSEKLSQVSAFDIKEDKKAA